MSKPIVTIRVPVDPSWDGGTRLQVYGDAGSGTVDFAKPLLARPAEVMPGRVEARPLGSQRLGVAKLADNKPEAVRNGRLEHTALGTTPLGTAPDFIEVAVPVGANYRPEKFAVRPVDRAGVEQSASTPEATVFVAATDPEPLLKFSFDSMVAGKARFAIV